MMFMDMCWLSFNSASCLSAADSRRILNDEEVENMLIFLLNHSSVSVQLAALQAVATVTENLVSRDAFGKLGRMDCICIFTPPPIGGRYCFRLISLFIYLFLCQQDYKKTAGPICMKFSGKVCSDHGTTWLHVGSIRANGSAGQRSICYHRT